MYCAAQMVTVKFSNYKLKHRVRESNVNSDAYINNQPTLSLLMTAPDWPTAKYQSPPKYSNNSAKKMDCFIRAKLPPSVKLD